MHVLVVRQPLQLAFTGEFPSYCVSMAYLIAIALLGVPPGQEFRAAIHAAERVPLSAH